MSLQYRAYERQEISQAFFPNIEIFEVGSFSTASKYLESGRLRTSQGSSQYKEFTA
jgi:hypothetical protein